MISPAPSASILMATRDAARYIDECLDSIEAQTRRDFELVVVDDGSGDDTADRVEARARREGLIRLYRRPRRGLVPALNEGMDQCRARIVVRMDADDRMHPERLRRQLSFLEQHPDIDVVGARVRAFPAGHTGSGMREYLRWQNACLSQQAMTDDIYLESPLTQPSAAFRRDVIVRHGGYRDGDFPEDYELWLRLTHAGCRFGKCPEVLLEWRQRQDSFSRTDARFSREAFDRLRARYLARDSRLAQGRPLIYWGAGRVTRKRCRHLIGHGFPPAAWVDIDARKLGKHVAGVPVVAPEWLDSACNREPKPLVLVYVASHGARELIAPRLEEMAYARGRDYLMVG